MILWLKTPISHVQHTTGTYYEDWPPSFISKNKVRAKTKLIKVIWYRRGSINLIFWALWIKFSLLCIFLKNAPVYIDPSGNFVFYKKNCSSHFFFTYIWWPIFLPVAYWIYEKIVCLDLVFLLGCTKLNYTHSCFQVVRSYAPPAALQKRLEALESPGGPPVIVYTENRKMASLRDNYEKIYRIGCKILLDFQTFEP